MAEPRYANEDYRLRYEDVPSSPYYDNASPYGQGFVPSPINIYQSQPLPQKPKSGNFVFTGLKYAFFGYLGLSAIIVTVLLILWKHWTWIGYWRTNSTRSTNETQGYMAVLGGAPALKAPPAYIFRAGYTVVTPFVYEKAAYTDDFYRNKPFFAYSARPKQKTAAYDLGEREGLRFIGDPNSNGTVGFAPLDYRLMQTFNYNVPNQPVLPVSPTPQEPLEEAAKTM